MAMFCFSWQVLFCRRNPLFSGSSEGGLLFTRRKSDPRLLFSAHNVRPTASVEESAEPMAAKKRILKEAIEKIYNVDVVEAAKKYNLESELFAEIDYQQINAFTEAPFSGNPAAVCYLPFYRDDNWLQLVAREFNLSATAFLVKRPVSRWKPDNLEDPNGLKGTKPLNNEFNLRWFTPEREVDLCGHATLASAHLLFSSSLLDSNTILFHTKSGVLKARNISGYDNDEETQTTEKSGIKKKRRQVGVGVVELDFPMVVATECGQAEISQIIEAIGQQEIVWAGCTNLGDYLVEVPSSKDVEQLCPQFEKMMDFPGRGGLIVTAQAREDSGFDFISRFFCPKAGIPEDPVTGSAHCTLGPYWAQKLGKTTLKAYQASKRGGKLSIRVEKNENRAYLQGGAILMMAGVVLNTLPTKK